MTVVLTSFFQSFETTKSFWCFVFVTLFNLQGTHRANLSRRICILAHPFSFVKSFFQVFSNFFRLSHSQVPAAFVTVLADSFDRIPQAVPFVNTFFQVFSNFFRCVPETALWFSRAAKRSLILSNRLHFVNTFFHLFPLFSPHFFHNYICRFFRHTCHKMCVLSTFLYPFIL